MSTERTALSVRFERFVDRSGDCWLWTGASTSFGHGVINRGGKYGKVDRAHRVAWELAHGPIPEDACVLHRCDVPACVNPAHLFLGSRADNNRDMHAKGRATLKRARGRDHWAAKLTEDDVRAVRKRRASGEILRTIAADFGISVQHVHRLASSQSYNPTG